MPSQHQLNQIKLEVENKGYAVNCPPDNFLFFSHQNVRELVNLLNNNSNNESYSVDFDESYYDSTELDEPWGNCVAIYLTESDNESKALAALNKYADDFVKNNPNTARNW